MLIPYSKLSVVFLLGLLSLGISPVAKAELHVQWLMSRGGQDCVKTCAKNRVTTYPMYSSVEHIKGSNKVKPISICATNKNYKDRRNKWLTGYNLSTGEVEAKSSCIISVDGKEVQGKRYYCLCTNHPLQPLGR